MAEGGQLLWKIQKVNQSRGPPGNYASVVNRECLPRPPNGLIWWRNPETREWKLVPEEEDASSATSGANNSTHSNGAAEGKVLYDGMSDNTAWLTNEQKRLSTANPSNLVEGVDYVMHTILPTDTFQGICLSYKLPATTLRRANNFSGTNLLLAPSKLIIPLHHLSKDALEGLRLQDTESLEYKVHTFRADLPHLKQVEALAYLELANGNVQEAIKAAKEDDDWEKDNKQLRHIMQRRKQQQEEEWMMNLGEGAEGHYSFTLTSPYLSHLCRYPPSGPMSSCIPSPHSTTPSSAITYTGIPNSKHKNSCQPLMLPPKAQSGIGTKGIGGCFAGCITQEREFDDCDFDDEEYELKLMQTPLLTRVVPFRSSAS